MSNVVETLNRLFERRRIVFWYDEAEELRGQFDAVEVPEVVKVEVQNNEFSLKYRMLRQEPQQKFLVYRSGPRPAYFDNWLLDVELAQEEFRASQVGLWLSSLGLSYDFAGLVEEHANFFKNAKRVESLLPYVQGTPTASQIRMGMLLVCVNAAEGRGRVDVVLEALLDELANDKDDHERLIKRCGLDTFLWEHVLRVYGYDSAAPGVHDFVITLFKSCYAMYTDGEVTLTSEAQVFLRRWKDSRRFYQSFEHHSAKCADQLGIKEDLANREYSALREVDCFQLIDKKILTDLVREVAERLISAGRCVQFVRSRRDSHWYADFKHHYGAVEAASRFMEAVDQMALEMEEFDEGIRKYTESWWKIDLLYRQFVFHARESGSLSLLEPLSLEVEQSYSNRFLLPLGDQWQAVVDKSDKWAPDPPQKQFFLRKVQSPFLDKNRKVCVIISDGLRYEVGHEFAERIRQENRYSATLSHMVTGLPSYTQLGMAALLPNTSLEIKGDKTASVLVDGNSSQGTENRKAILEAVPNKKGTAIRSKDLLEMNASKSRALFRDHDFVYVYHNVIDSTGDKAATEERVFEACDQTLEELTQLVKKLTASNASNIVVTADHGFIYQNGVQESDFSAPEANVAADYRDRRFLLGTSLESPSGLHHYTSKQVGLTGDMEVLIPNGINRLRLSGSGCRYVHGGCTLQEVVVPVIEINKSKKDDVAKVPVEIIQGNSSNITTSQMIVRLYQAEASTEKLHPRTLTVGLFDGLGEDSQLLSDTHEVLFDRESDDPREREHTVKLVLSREADEFNGKQVYLILRERIEATTHVTNYKEQAFTIRQSFDRDFDF